MSHQYFPENRGWSNHTVRLISQVASDGADFGEIQRALEGVKVGDVGDWYSHWYQMAEYVESLGKAAVNEGRSVTAWKSFFRSSNYYRQSQAFLEFGDPRKVPAYLKTAEVFREGCKHHDPQFEWVQFPYGNDTLDGYVFPGAGEPAGGSARRPGLIWFGGADSPAEELFFQGASEAVGRGITVLAVNGPGIGLSLYQKGMRSIPDYEKPYSAAMDYLVKRADVDPGKVAIMGNSMGGYYVLRAAAFEKRAKACIAYDVGYDLIHDLYDYYKPIQRTLQSVVGAKDDADARRILSAFNLRGVCSEITCPTLLTHGDSDYIMDPSAVTRAKEEMKCPTTVKMWKGTHSMREYHKEALAYMFDWALQAMA